MKPSNNNTNHSANRSNLAMMSLMNSALAMRNPKPSTSTPTPNPPQEEIPAPSQTRMIRSQSPQMVNLPPALNTNKAPPPVEENEYESLSVDQIAAIKDVMAGKNILLTGPAGTGKSYTIHRIKQMYSRRGLKIGITSTTGKSAILIEGKTIHSWAGIGICGSKESALKRVMQYKPPQQRILETNLLVIDEISMLSGHMLDILDYVFRMVRHRQEPFGGMQILLSGDFYQLKPVKSDSYAFDSPNWDKYIHSVHELRFIFRQKDLDFCTALNEVRIGEVSPKTVELFSQCMNREFDGVIKPTELYPVNESVDMLNEDELWKLASETNMVVTIDALDEIIQKPKSRWPINDKFKMDAKQKLNKDCIAPEVLQLLVGAQVMLTQNINVEGGLANGSRGVVTGFGPNNEPIVRFINNIEMQLETNTWYTWINETTKIVRRQYPLKLAWAMSIHKSQGSSVDRVRVDLGERVFGEGMSYVALSRVRSLEGLSIMAIDWDSIKTSRKVKEFYEACRRKLENQEPLKRTQIEY